MTNLNTCSAHTSQPDPAKLPTLGKPGKPTVTLRDPTSVSVSWAAAPTAGCGARYVVRWLLHGSKASSAAARKEANGTSAQVDGLEAGKTYTVWVEASADGVQSAESEKTDATIPGAQPGPHPHSHCSHSHCSHSHQSFTPVIPHE